MISSFKVGQRNVEYLIEGSGEKTVAIMVGMECSFYDWLDIAYELSKYARVIITHRPGVGNSDPHPEGSTTEIAAKDMYYLLKELNISKNVILVGHSYGGVCVQHFARLYGEMVESIVLVESSSMEAYKINELELPIMDETNSDEEYMKLWTKYSKFTREELIEEIKPELSPKQKELPLEMQKEILEVYVRPEMYINQLSELHDVRNNIMNIKYAGEFPCVPLKILIKDSEYSIKEMIEEGAPRDEAERLEGALKELAYGLKDLSSMSELKVVEKSNHCMNETRPDAIIETIKELI